MKAKYFNGSELFQFMKHKDKFFIGRKLLESKLFNIKTPLVIAWAITYRCNYECKYCNRWEGKTNELGTNKVLSIIGELHELGCRKINFTGGEPLLRKDLHTVIKYIKSKDIYVGMNSNGALLGKNISILKYLNYLTLSLDGPEKINDKLRAKGSYKKVIDALILAKKHNVKVSLTAVITKYNIDYIQDILKISQKYQVKFFFQPMYFANKSFNNKYNPSINKYRQIYTDLINLKKAGNKFIGNSIPGLNYLRDWPKIKQVNCAFNIRCRIEPNGDLYACSKLIRKNDPPNCVKLGFRKAFELLNINNCRYLCCAKNLELNLANSLNIESMMNLTRTFT